MTKSLSTLNEVAAFARKTIQRDGGISFARMEGCACALLYGSGIDPFIVTFEAWKALKDQGIPAISRGIVKEGTV